MRAALIDELGRPPRPAEPPDAEGEGALVEILAAPLNPIDIAVGAGKFFGGHPELPFVPGCEGVGRIRGGDGGLVYIFSDGLGLSRNGAIAELARSGSVEPIPVPGGADPAVAAALGIAGLAGWLPFAWRAPLRGGETVLVLGATGTVGVVAVQAARLLGAGRVVAAGRDAARLERAREAGADAVVPLEGDGLAERLKEACGGEGPSYVFDPLWGAPLLAALQAAAPRARVVNLGQSAGAEAAVTSAAVRGKLLELYGHTNFGVPRQELAEQYHRLVSHAVAGRLTVDVERVSLDDVGAAWGRQAEGASRKLVVIP